MTSNYWFRYTYPSCPDDLNENQKLKKYQILQYKTSNTNGHTKKTDIFSFYAKNSRNTISKITNCTGYNPPSASDVPGKTWDLDVTESMINTSSILNDKHTITASGPSTWEYTKTN